MYLVAISFVGFVSGKPRYLTRPTKGMKWRPSKMFTARAEQDVLQNDCGSGILSSVPFLYISSTKEAWGCAGAEWRTRLSPMSSRSSQASFRFLECGAVLAATLTSEILSLIRSSETCAATLYRRFQHSATAVVQSYSVHRGRDYWFTPNTLRCHCCVQLRQLCE